MRYNYFPRGLGLTAALSIAFLSTVPIARSAEDPLREVLQSRYAAMKAAMAAHDGPGIAAILAPNFVSVDVSGKSENASQTIAEVNALKTDPDKSSNTTLSSISPGSTAVTVEQRYDMKTKSTTADGTQHDVELVTLSTDTWVKSGNVWLIERTVTDDVTYFVDGKLTAHRAKPSS